MVTPQQLQEALGSSKDERRQARQGLCQPRLRPRRGDHEPPFAPVRRALDQPRSLRGRPRHHQDHPFRDVAEVPDPAAQPLRRDPDHRHGRSHQRLRHGRHQVHDRLQRGAGGGIRDLARGGDREVLRLDALPAAQAGRRWWWWRGRRRRSIHRIARPREDGRGAVAQGRHGRPDPELRRHGLRRPLRGRHRLHGGRGGGRRDGQDGGRRDRPRGRWPSRRKPRPSSSSRTSS